MECMHMQLKQPIINLDVEWRIIAADTLLIGLALRFSMLGVTYWKHRLFLSARA